MPSSLLDSDKKLWLIVLDEDGDVLFQGGSLPFTKYQLENMIENGRFGYSFPGALMAKLNGAMTVIYPPGMDIYILLEWFQDVIDFTDSPPCPSDFMHHSQELHSMLLGEEAARIKWRNEQCIRIREEYFEGGRRMRGKITTYNGTFPCAPEFDFKNTLPISAFVNPVITGKGMLERGTTTLAKYDGMEWKNVFFKIYFDKERSAWRVEFLREVEWLQVYFPGASFTDRSLYPNNLNSTLSVESGKGCTWTITNGKGGYVFSFQEAGPSNRIKVSWRANDSVAQVTTTTNFQIHKSSVGNELNV